MAKNKVFIDVVVDDKGTTKRVAVNAKKLGLELDKTAESAQTADRRLKGASQQSANSTKNFSKMAQGISGGLVPAYATLAAQVFAVSAAFQFLRSASEVRNLIAGQEALGAATGVAYKTITNSIKEATDGQLGYAEAARAAAIGTAAGLSPSQLDALGNAAKNASFALGRDLTDSFNRLVRGVTKAEPELLDELGIILRLKESTEEYADAIKKPVDELTAFERTQAVTNNVLTQAEKKFGAIQKIMDPSAASLNKFLVSFENLINTLKEGIAGGLAPVFEFLSERTLSLTAALGLFAIPIVRSILPSFSDWGETAQKNFDMQSDKLKALDKDYDKIRMTIKNLGADRDQVLKGNQEFNRSLAKSAGVDVSSAKSTGKGGVDFLFGGAVSRESQKNAEMMLTRAQAQIDKHGKIINSKLKGMNQQQLNDLKKSYTERAAVLKKFERQHATTYEKATLHVKTYVVKSKAAVASLQKFTAKASGRIAGALSAAFNIAGWIGIVLLAVDGIKALIDVFFPLEEAVQKANKAIENFTDKSASLNEELDRTATTVNDMSLLTLQESVSAIGRAFQSADLNAQFKAFEALDPSNSNFPEAEKSFRDTLNALSRLNPEFEELAKNLDLTKITKEAKEEILALANALMVSGAAVKDFNQGYSDVLQQLTELSGGAKSLDPTVTLRQGLKKTVNEGETAVKGLENQILTFADTAGAELSKAQDKLKELQSRSVDSFRTDSIFGGTYSARQEKRAEAIAAQELVVAEAKAKQNTEMEEFSKELAEQQNKLAYMVSLEEAFTENAKRLNEIQNKINSNTEKAAELRTEGFTIDEKLSNLQADRLMNENKLLSVQYQQENAQTRFNAATEEGSKATEAEIAASAAQLAVANANLENAQRIFTVQGQIISRKERELELEKLLNKEGRIRYLAEERQRIAQLGTLRRSGQLATTMAGAGGIERRIRLATLEQQIAGRSQKTAEKRAILEDAYKDKLDIVYLRKSAELEVEEAITEEMRKQLELITKRPVDIQLAGVARETDRLRGEVQDFSFNPAQREFNRERRRIENETGQVMTDEQLQRLKEATLAQQALNFELESMDALYNTISNSMTQALTGLISGTMSVKEAFAQMAKAIIQQLIQIIAQMITMRILMSTIGFSFGAPAGGGVSVPAATSSPMGFYRYGGMAQPPAYASQGGVFTGKDSGYPAVLHGTEAVVPLPNNRSIPVELSGNAGGTNNVTVNVNVDNEGNATQTSEADGIQGANLGKAIANAVQQELLNQKRAGGILNPYGVA